MTSSGAAAEEEPPLRRFYFGDLYKDGGYQPLHPELFDPMAQSRWTPSTSQDGNRPKVADGEGRGACGVRGAEGDVHARGWLAAPFLRLAETARQGEDLRSELRKEAPGVYSFEMFTPEFCDLLLEEVEHAQRTRRADLERPNGMNRYGIVLNQLGLEPLITALLQEHLLPVQSALWPKEGASPDDHHCFIVRYKAGEDVGLDMHEDDSEVTLNVCLGKEFSGATLSFCGLVSDEDHRRFKRTCTHEKGRAILHLGRHRHGADNIDSGERVNFILWSVNNEYRASDLYRESRSRAATSLEPDRICLSYTHDRDYASHLALPSTAEAIARGVMLDVVEKRRAQLERPVHDLARPIEEINTRPSVLLFLEGLPPQRQHALFSGLMAAAEASRARCREAGCEAVASSIPHEARPLFFFVAVQSIGAVPQVRGLSGAKGSPALVIIDIDKELRYPFFSGVAAGAAEGAELSSEAIGAFVEAFEAGALKAEPLGGDEGPQPGSGHQPEAEPEEQPTQPPTIQAKEGTCGNGEDEPEPKRFRCHVQ